MKKIYLAILTVLVLASCQKPTNYLKEAQDFFKADEKMELKASATKIELNRDDPDGIALSFEWTSAREMPEEYIPTYVTKIDITGNNFNTCIRAVEDDDVRTKSFTHSQLQSYILEKWSKSYVRPVNIEFCVLCKWDGGDKYVMPEVRTVAVEVKPYKPLTFDVDKMYLAGTAVTGTTRLLMKTTPEDEFQYTAHLKLKPGVLNIPVVYDGETSYIAPADLDGREIMDGEDENVTMRPDALGWTINEEGTYRVIVNIQNKTIRIHSPKTDPQPKVFSGHFKIGSYDEDITFTLDPAGNKNGQPWGFGIKGDNVDGGGWSKTGLNFEFSGVDPQLLVYKGDDIKGDQVFVILNWLTSDNLPYTNVNSAFYIFPREHVKKDYQVNKNTWYPIAYAFCKDPYYLLDGEKVGDENNDMRGINFLFRNDVGTITPVNFVMIDFRNDRILFDKQ